MPSPPPPVKLRLFTPIVSLPQCLQLLRDFERGTKLENDWDERVMRHLLLNPPPSNRVLAAAARIAKGEPLEGETPFPAHDLGPASPGGKRSGARSPARPVTSPTKATGRAGFSIAESLVKMQKQAAAAAAAAAAGAASAATAGVGKFSPQRRALGPDGQHRRASEQMAASYGVSDVAVPSTDTALHIAADEGDEAAVRRLLHAGHDPNSRNLKMQVGSGFWCAGWSGTGSQPAFPVHVWMWV